MASDGNVLFGLFVLAMFSPGWLGATAFAAALPTVWWQRAVAATVAAVGMVPLTEDGGPALPVMVVNVVAFVWAAHRARRRGELRPSAAAVGVAAVLFPVALFLLEPVPFRDLLAVQGAATTGLLLTLFVLWVRACRWKAVPVGLMLAVTGREAALVGLFPAYTLAVLLTAAAALVVRRERDAVSSRSGTPSDDGDEGVQDGRAT